MAYKKLIWFKPSYDNTENMPQIVYVVYARGAKNCQVWWDGKVGTVRVTPEYYNKHGENMGLKNAKEGRGTFARLRDLIPFSDEAWAACEEYIAFHARFREEARQWKDRLKQGKTLRQKELL